MHPNYFCQSDLEKFDQSSLLSGTFISWILRKYPLAAKDHGEPTNWHKATSSVSLYCTVRPTSLHLHITARSVCNTTPTFSDKRNSISQQAAEMFPALNAVYLHYYIVVSENFPWRLLLKMVSNYILNRRVCDTSEASTHERTVTVQSSLDLP